MKVLATLFAALIAFFTGHHAPVVGGITADVTWQHTVGQPLYDTPSGNWDTGFYIIDSHGTLTAHYSSLVTATGTLPDGYYNVPGNTIPGGFTLAHIVGTQYIDYFSDGSSYVGPASIDSNLSKPNATVPSATYDAANSTQLTAPTI